MPKSRTHQTSPICSAYRRNGRQDSAPGPKPPIFPSSGRPKFDLIVNLKTANALGLPISESFLARGLTRSSSEAGPLPLIVDYLPGASADWLADNLKNATFAVVEIIV